MEALVEVPKAPRRPSIETGSTRPLRQPRPAGARRFPRCRPGKPAAGRLCRLPASGDDVRVSVSADIEEDGLQPRRILIYVSVYIHVFTYILTSVYVYVCIWYMWELYVHIYIYIYACAHIHIHICIYTSTYGSHVVWLSDMRVFCT